MWARNSSKTACACSSLPSFCSAMPCSSRLRSMTMLEAPGAATAASAALCASAGTAPGAIPGARWPAAWGATWLDCCIRRLQGKLYVNDPNGRAPGPVPIGRKGRIGGRRSEEHTSELQSQSNLVCRLLLEKKREYRGCREQAACGLYTDREMSHG